MNQQGSRTLHRAVYWSAMETVKAKITASDLPPAGPVFVVCLTAESLAERRRLFDLLTAATKWGVSLGLTVVVDEEERPAQELLAL